MSAIRKDTHGRTVFVAVNEIDTWGKLLLSPVQKGSNGLPIIVTFGGSFSWNHPLSKGDLIPQKRLRLAA